MSADRAPLASVEQVREELRRLGYLETGLDRFVLSGAGAASPLRACLGAALRVGVAGGILVGVALALAAAGLDRRLRSEPRDLAVLALYLVALSGFATAAGALLGGLAAAWAGRRLQRRPGPTLSRNIGLALALAGLAYLALWWRSHAVAAAPALQLAVLVVGVGLSLALGRFGALAAVAVLAAGGVADRLPQASLSRHRMRSVVLAAAVLGGGGVAAASFLAPAPPDTPDFAVLPTGVRVRVLGIDGLDARMAEQMMARGELEHLRALVARGARATLHAEPEQVPAIVWTTIATGRGPEAHGIQSAGARRIAGVRTPVPLSTDGRFARALASATDLLRLTREQPPSAVLREVKAFWNVASEKGLRVGVVNWWATWPADPVNGFIVTDRAFFKLEKGGAADREAHPPEAFDRLRPLMAAGAPRSPGDREQAGDRPRMLDRFHLDAARHLRGVAAPDLEAVYLPGLDIFTMQQLGDAPPPDLAGLDARLDAVRAYYRFVDGLIGEAQDGLGPQDALVVIGDPGRLARRTEPAAEGLLVLAGGPFAAGDLGRVSERDLAPTLLHLAGLPISLELDGRVLEAALTPGFRQAHPVRAVASYGRRPASRPSESAFDQEMLEELRSLGYIQ